MILHMTPILAITIIAGCALGSQSGFLVGAMIMFVSILFRSRPMDTLADVCLRHGGATDRIDFFAEGCWKKAHSYGNLWDVGRLSLRVDCGLVDHIRFDPGSFPAGGTEHLRLGGGY